MEDTSNRDATKHFKMTIHKKYKCAMDRQLSEALNIAKAGGLDSPNLMNAKEEDSHCVVPQIEVSGARTMFKTMKRPREDNDHH